MRAFIKEDNTGRIIIVEVTQKSILGLKYRVQCDITKLKAFVEMVEADLVFFPPKDYRAYISMHTSLKG